MFMVNKPSVWLYESNNLVGEVSDELLFGTTIEILSENDSTAYVRTDYGYCGYLNRWDICECTEQFFGESERVTVNSRCDLLSEGAYFLKPYMSIPRGSRVRIAERLEGRFSLCRIGRRLLYIPNYAIEPLRYDCLGAGIAMAASLYLGAPYRWGGKSDCGIDCSGLAFMSSRLCGVEIYRDAVFDKRYVSEVADNEVAAGDFAYLKGHVVVMTGRNSYIHASASACRVVTGFFGDGVLSKESVLCFARIKKDG